MPGLTDEQARRLRSLVCSWLPGDAVLATMATARGMLTRTQREEAERELAERREAGDRAGLAMVLNRRGWLPGREYLRLLRAHAPGEASEILETRSEAPTPTQQTGHETHLQKVPPSRMVGRYRIIREVGRGGMGIVYEAEDVGLRRRVALKILRGESADPRMIRRLRREAAAAGRLRHPHIVQVHDLGEADECHYIAMEFVEGDPLGRRLSSDVPLRDRIALLKQVADALGFAHVAGVVHRDVKPGNVIVDRAGAPRLCDFGLARVEGDFTRLTRSGAALGTPAYMAPEQCLGHDRRVGPPTDVWALGVILYEVLTGAPPFTAGDLFSIYHKILDEEPVAPSRRVPDVPRELEAICLKALSKDPHSRYIDAREMADDMARWMNGGVVQARPVGPWTRTIRRVRKHRRPLVTSLLALLVAGTVTGVLAWKWQREREAALSAMRDTARLAMSAALDVRRAGFGERMESYLPSVEQACADAIERAPDLAEPHYLLGRMYRTLMWFPEALRCQERALEQDPNDLRARYERGILLVRMFLEGYDRELQARRDLEGGRLLDGSWDGGRAIHSRDLTEVPELAALRDRALADLDVVVAAGPRFNASQSEAARGWAAFLRTDREASREAFERALAADPPLEEVHEGLACLAGAAQRWDEVLHWYTLGHERDRGFVPHLIHRAAMLQALAVCDSSTGKDPEPRMRQAIADLEEACRHERDARQLHAFAGDAALRLASLLTQCGRDPLADLDAAERHFTCTAQAAPRPPQHALPGALRREEELYFDAKSRSGRARCLWLRAILCASDLDEAESLYARALAEFEEARKAADDRGILAHQEGLLLVRWAGLRMRRGRDAADLSEKAIQALTQARLAFPGAAEAWTTLGLARARLALGQAALSGSDPLPVLDQGIQEIEAGLKLSPDLLQARVDLAGVRQDRAFLLVVRGEDADAEFEAAEEEVGRALDAEPNLARGRACRGGILLSAAGARLGAGLDAGDRLSRAMEDLDIAIRLSPNLFIAWMYRGLAHSNLGIEQVRRGEEPSASFQRSVDDLTRALEIESSNVECLLHRVRARVIWAQKAGGDRTESLFRLAVEDCDKAAAVQPWSPEPLLNRARCWYGLGQIQGAIDDLEAAVKLRPALAQDVEDTLNRFREEARRTERKE